MQRIGGSDFEDRLQRYKSRLYQLAKREVKDYPNFIIRILSIMKKSLMGKVFMYNKIPLFVTGEIEDMKVINEEHETQKKMKTYIIMEMVTECKVENLKKWDKFLNLGGVLRNMKCPVKKSDYLNEMIKEAIDILIRFSEDEEIVSRATEIIERYEKLIRDSIEKAAEKGREDSIMEERQKRKREYLNLIETGIIKLNSLENRKRYTVENVKKFLLGIHLDREVIGLIEGKDVVEFNAKKQDKL